jgi:hypothetical protein
MYGGIDQLVDTYKGNPQPLQAKVQKAQQSQPPGEVPPDLEEALALQEIAELRTGAQNQQAIQAGGAQPSVVDKLRQMLGGIQQQAQMAQGAPAQQGQPVMAARGGSIDQLMSNLGRHYAGGGIVAFNGKDGSDVPTEAELEAQRKADREKIDALAKALGQTGGEYAGKSMAALADIASLIPRGLAGAVDTALVRPARALGAKVDYLSPALTPGNQNPDTMTPFYDRYIRAKEGAASSQVKPTPVSDAPLDAESEKLKRLAASQAQTGVNTNPALKPRPPVEAAAPAAPRPSTGGPNTGGPAAPAIAAAEKLDPNSLRGLTEAYIRGEFGLSPDAERDKAVEFARRTMGLDALLGEKERRASEREASIKQAQENRMPAWVEALSAAGKPVRGGLGTLLGQMGNQAQATREGYQAQDLKYQAELAQLRDVITDAKISGNKELVKEGMAAYKEIDARRRAAATNATSLVNTDENVAMRKQTAKDALAGRNQAASIQAQNVALAREERTRQFNEEQLRKIRQNDVDRANKIEAAIGKRAAMIDMSLQNPKLKPEEEAALQARRNAIVKQVQAEYPPVKPEKPSESQFLTAARKANPGVSDADLKAYYKQNYGS